METSLRRYSCNPISFKDWLLYKIFPAFGVSNPVIKDKKVVLPEPLLPKIA